MLSSKTSEGTVNEQETENVWLVVCRLISQRGITYGSLMSPYQTYLPIPWALPLSPVPHVRRHHWISSYQHTTYLYPPLTSPLLPITVVGQRLSSFSFLFPRFLIPRRDNAAACVKTGLHLQTCSSAYTSPPSANMRACNYHRDDVSSYLFLLLSFFFPPPPFPSSPTTRY